MDVYVDTEELESGANSMMHYFQELMESASAIESCFDDAINDFDTINYDRASESVKSATTYVKEIKDSIEQLQEHIRSLSDTIEQYDGLRY